MPLDGNNREVRQLRIRELLLERQHYSVPELCAELNCSEATVRNDLHSMEKRGVVKRVYGGVVPTAATPPYEGMAARHSFHREEKLAVSRLAVAKYIEPDSTIILDAGTTIAEMARLVAALPFHVNVLTNSLTAAAALSAGEHHVLHLAGGVYNALSGAFRDQTTLEHLRSIHADTFFMCPTGISFEAGFVVPEAVEAQIKRTMLERSRRVIALSDHSKVGKNSFCVVCGLDRVDALILDDRAGAEEVERLRSAGCAVEIAPMPEPGG